MRPRLKSAGVEYLGLEGPLEAGRRRRPEWPWDFATDPHWNVAAHRLAAEVVTAMVRAPSMRATCTAWMPTPPLAPVTSTASPGRTAATFCSPWYAVPKAHGTTAACSNETPSGTGTSARSATATYSA